MRNVMLRLAIVGVVVASVSTLVDLRDVHAQGSATVGSIRGVVRDKATGESVAGATVVATSPALQGEQITITDESGQYYVTSLPPGVYTLTIYYADAAFTRSSVLVQLGKDVVVNVPVDSGSSERPRGEVIELTGTAPIVDQGSTKIGLTLTDHYTRNVPTARTFGGIVGQAAGAQADNYGISLAGATSSENIYVVEGINTTDTGFGGLSSNLPNEFIQETEVITGGYNAEFGRATGGIVNVVTKQGSDQWHGSVYGYLQPGALIADAKVVQREGGSIDSKRDLDYRYDLGAELGGPIITKRLWFHVGFNPSFEQATTTRLVQRQVDGTDGNPADGIPDVDPDTGITKHELVAQSEIPSTFKQYFFTAKLTGAIDPNNQFQVSAFGNPRSAVDVYNVTGNPRHNRWKYTDGAYDVSAKWTSKLAQGKTQFDVVAGYHRGFNRQSPYSAEQEVPFIFYNYDRSLYDFVDLEGDAITGCADSGNDPYPEITNCPVFGYSEQGIDLIENQLKSRTSVTASVTQRVRARGMHIFKAGVDAELTRFAGESRYSGGVRLRRSSDSLAGEPGVWQTDEYYRFVERADPTQPLEPGQVLCANGAAVCERSPGLKANTTNRNLAAFVQDSWQLMSNLTLNVGLRWDQQVAYVAEHLQGKASPEGEVIPATAFQLDALLSPRVGVIYDPTRDGKSKVFSHYGRFYESVPMDLNVRAYGGEIVGLTDYNVSRRVPSAGGYDPNCDVDHSSGATGTEVAMRLEQCQDRGDPALLGGGVEYVSPGLRGQYTDEIVAGAEYELASNFKVGASFIYRNLPVVIEDISVDGGNTYLITNPGYNFDEAAADLEAQAAQLMNGSPEDMALAELLLGRAASLAAVKHVDRPQRIYRALQLTATQRPTEKSLLIASYTYARSVGNFPGLFSTETGQNDPNITSMYDLPDLMANRYGPLGLDRPHSIKLDGFYLFDLEKAGQLVVGASARAQSGIPHNVLASHPIYGSGEAYLLPRGSAPRSPVTAEVDTRLAYGYRLSKATKLEAFVTVFNLLDAQNQLNTDENYTFNAANPIIGGDVGDLEHVKTIDEVTGQEINMTPVKNKNYGHTGANTGQITRVQQVPRTIQLGFRISF
ncbi:MAG TPA: TonB-dependent receptor [Kofleriaceae bacterium]